MKPHAGMAPRLKLQARNLPLEEEFPYECTEIIDPH